jgi:RNA polymerase sigma-70 factor (ECF subfamily)
MWLRERRCSRFVWIDKSLSSSALDTIRGGPLTRMELVDQRALPEDEFADRELTEVFKREIRRIPPSMRNALVMADIDRLPIRDVAEQLGITVPAAKSRLMRARSELKLRMKKFCGLKGAATLIGRPVHSTTAYARG